MKNILGRRARGQTLVMVLLILSVTAIMIPAIVFWLRSEAKWSVKESRNTVAFNLADGAVERGMWKLKSSTSTWDAAAKGTLIAGYNNDLTYSDMPGGYYRIKFSSGPSAGRVTVIGEGKDTSSNEIRAVQVVFQNSSVPGAVIARGVITWANAFSAHWGPIMSQNNINITDANAAQDYFPRKLSKQVVTCNSKGYARDTNGLDPPNTDGVEWWSGYNVPDLPVLDFEAMKSSAIATNTYNIYGCKKTGASWDGRSSCSINVTPHAQHFGNPWYHPLARKNYTWYWDSDVTLAGSTGDDGCGIWGTVICRGNLTLATGDNYSYTGHVPPEAWMEYGKITKSGGDTSTKNQYPADDGYQKSRSTFGFGSETWTGGPIAGNTDIGIRGFIYCGGNLDIEGPLDINGAVWVEGTVSKAVGSERCVIFFDDTLNVPSLNVVLVRKSWAEILPSSQAWANP